MNEVVFMFIEKAFENDAKVISELIFSEFPYTKANEDNVKLRMQKPHIKLFKGVEKGEIAGFVELECLDNLFGVWRINGVTVSEKFRQKGFGKQLSEFAVEFAKKQKASKILLLVRPDNYVAKKIYKKLGFQSTGLWKSQINGKRAEEWVLELEKNYIA